MVSLKVTDIDRERQVIRVEQGKGRKDRYAMLSPDLLALLRAWWRAGHQKGVMLPGGWLFPGQNPVNPLTARQLSRIFHVAKEAAGIGKKVSLHTLRHCFATHLLEQKVDIRVIQVLLGHAKLNTTAHYSQVDSRTLKAVKSPLELLPAKKGRKKVSLAPGSRAPGKARGRGYLPQPWTGLAPGQRRASEPRPVESDVGHRALPYRGARRPCGGLPGLRPHPGGL